MGFGWEDLSTPQLEMMLNIVQVMTHSLRNNQNIAVHCHAGLGRTGLAIACYLVYAQGLTSDEAITLVRQKRPGSIQNRKQTLFVFQFEKYLKKLQKYYPSIPLVNSSQVEESSCLSLYSILDNQSLYLHGSEQRQLKMVPKVLFKLIKRIQSLYTSELQPALLEGILGFDVLDWVEPEIQNMKASCSFL
jgi:hypothetical protein